MVQTLGGGGRRGQARSQTWLRCPRTIRAAARAANLRRPPTAAITRAGAGGRGCVASPPRAHTLVLASPTDYLRCGRSCSLCHTAFLTRSMQRPPPPQCFSRTASAAASHLTPLLSRLLSFSTDVSLG